MSDISMEVIVHLLCDDRLKQEHSAFIGIVDTLESLRLKLEA
jgi:hypothetical protein